MPSCTRGLICLVQDLQSATRQAYSMIATAGMSPALGNMDFATDYSSLSASTKTKIEDEVRKTVELGRQRATEILTTHREELDILAKALVEYETLSLDEMKKVLKGEKLPKMSSAKGSGIKLSEILLPTNLGGISNGSPPPSPPPQPSMTSSDE